jgi:peroxiredoxin
MISLLKKYIVPSLKIILIIVFLGSGILKILSFEEFLYTISSYYIIPQSITIYFASLIILTELLIGLFLLFDIVSNITLMLSLFVICSFTLFILYSIIYNKDYSCNCFGNLLSGKINYLTLIRNIIIAIIIFLVYKHPVTLFSVEKLNTNRILLLFLIFIVLSPAINYLLLTKDNRQLRIGEKIQNIKFTDINGNDIDTKLTKESFLLIIIFSLKDCPKCLLEGYYWDQFKLDYKTKVYVIGIAKNSTFDEVQLFIKQKKITFPIYLDNSNLFLRNSEYVSPIKILLNKERIIVDLSVADGSSENVKKYQQRLALIIKRQLHKNFSIQ